MLKIVLSLLGLFLNPSILCVAIVSLLCDYTINTYLFLCCELEA